MISTNGSNIKNLVQKKENVKMCYNMCRQHKTCCEKIRKCVKNSIKCAGNEKLGAKKEPDPDPAPYLFLTFEMKRYFPRY